MSWTPVDVVGLGSGVVAIAAGWYHNCALTAAGGLKCWGYGAQGQLGNGSTATQPTPVDVTGLTSGVAAVAAGAFHTCALTTAGGMKCWGRGDLGQLGDGTTFFRQVPVDVSGLASGVSSIALGWDHSCAITTAGGLKCWGYNSNGQLGDGTNADKSSPVDVAGLASGVAMASGGAVHTCAIASGGVAKCWGSQPVTARLGDGSAIDSNVPVDVWLPPKNSKSWIQDRRSSATATATARSTR